MKLKIAIWNTEWAKPGSARESSIKGILGKLDPDIICITEGYLQSWADEGCLISSEEDYGYQIHDGRRKVILVSRQPWEDVRCQGPEIMPPGRFCSGATFGIQCYGVCIPWKSAHVTTGNKNRKIWEDHVAYLYGLKSVLGTGLNPSIVFGDYNQRIPRRYSPVDVFQKLIDTFEPDYKIATLGEIAGLNKPVIDHLAACNKVKTTSIVGIPAVNSGKRLSDHDGLSITVEVKG